MPVDVQAKLYRANDIENFDTSAIRCRVKGGAEILFYTSHAAGSMLGPVIRFEFEKGVVSLNAPDPVLPLNFKSGSSSPAIMAQ